MVESMVVECLLTMCPMPDHTLSDGAEVGRIQRKWRAKIARREKTTSSLFQFTAGCEFCIAPSQLWGILAEPLTELRHDVVHFILFLIVIINPCIYVNTQRKCMSRSTSSGKARSWSSRCNASSGCLLNMLSVASLAGKINSPLVW